MSKKVVIVGGVAGGASAAARLRRLDESAEITVYEKGGSVSFANCGMPYYIGGIIAKREELLLQTPKSFYQRFRIQVKVGHEVLSIDTASKKILVKNFESGETFEDSYDVLVLSPGAKAIVPLLPSLDSDNVFTLRSMEDNDRIKAFLDAQNPSSCVILGGGFIGLEVAENLIQKGIAVTMVQRSGQVFAPMDPEMASPIATELLKEGVHLRLNSEVSGYEDGFVALKSGEKIKADFILLSIGVTPDNTLAKSAGLSLNDKGGIVVDEHMRTSDPNIYAVGDAIQVKDIVLGSSGQKPLAGPANKQGRVVADNICGIPSKFEGSQGTAIVKVFGLSAAVTGVNEKILKTTDIPYHAVWLHPATHATYYPGSKQFALKVIFHKETGALLGAQAVGTEGVDKRMDVLATALRAKLTIRDLQELELCYAPPFSSAKDPVNFVGFVGANILDGYDPQISWDELAKIDPEKELILDVRTKGEFEGGHITGAKLMPVDDLRDILVDLPEDKTAPIHLYCRVGIRGYIAARILKQNGYTNVHNLSGGWLTWENAMKAKKG